MRIGMGNSTGILLGRARALRQARVRAVNLARTNTAGRIGDNYHANLLRNTQNNPLYSNGNVTDTVSGLQEKSNYTMIRKAAGDLQDYAEKLLETGEDSLFGKALPECADETGKGEETDEAGRAEPPSEEELAEARENVLNEINRFTDSYNVMISRMGMVSGTDTEWYERELNSYVAENRSALAAVGITQKSDGTLKVNQDKLEGADMAKLQKLFQGKDSFAGKTASMAKAVETSAATALTRVGNSYYSSGSYNRYGNAYDNYSGGGWYNSRG